MHGTKPGCHPWEASDRLPGRTECDHVDSHIVRAFQNSTVGRSSSIIFQSVHVILLLQGGNP